MHLRRIACATALVAGLSACSGSPLAVAPSAPSAPRTAGGLTVTEVAGGLSHVWDIGVLPDGRALITERQGRISLLSSVRAGASVTPLAADLDDVRARGEGGLMGLVVHPDFATSRLFTTCHNTGEDIRLVTWRLSADDRAAERVKDPLVGGLPVNPSGRHSGCRPTIAADGSLLVGTGDTARGGLPQDLTSLGGKVLRVDLATGGPVPGNPFATAADPRERLVFSYGHRNVQGVAVEPGTGRVWAAEHGPDVDDEVNVVAAGSNAGWAPAAGGYDESVPMTDRERFPDAVDAAWSSGSSTEAVAGAAFLRDGRLAVAALKGQKLLVMTIGGNTVTSVEVPAALDDTYGRLRGVRLAPDGALLVTTSNGRDDKVLRVDAP